VRGGNLEKEKNQKVTDNKPGVIALNYETSQSRKKKTK